MENEKKTPENGSSQQKKGKPNRPKSYFITPNEGQQKNGNSAPSSPSQNKPRNDAQGKSENKNPSEHKNGNGNGKSHSSRRRHHGKGNQKPNAQKSAEQTANAQAAQPKPQQKQQKPQQKQQNAKDGRPVANAEKNAPSVNQTTAQGDAQNRSKHNRRSRHKNHSKPINGEVRLAESLGEEKPTVTEKEEIEIPETVDASSISPDILESPVSMVFPDETTPRIEVVGVRFKSSGKVYYFDPEEKKYARGQAVIVETARGMEYGDVSLPNTMVKETDVVPPLRPIVRAATEADQAHQAENHKKEQEAFRICNQKIAEHKLDMKLIDAQYTFDNSKLLFYFTSAGRVDFRDLVKDLASVFRTRIELRQIGIRDEAKLIGGLGLCGRPLCCAVFLSDFGQVSIKMAKEQNFSLNSSKISGACGRLMCCLRYEHETYEQEIKLTPPVDAVVQTPDGNGVVIENSPLAGTVKVRLSVTPEVAPKIYHRDDVTVLQRKQNKQNGNS